MAGRTIGTRVCSALKELCKHGKVLVEVTLQSSLVCSYIQNQSFKIKADEENLSYLKILYTKKLSKTNTRHSSNVGLMLDQRLRRWPNDKPTLDECLVFAGCPMDLVGDEEVTTIHLLSVRYTEDSD